MSEPTYEAKGSVRGSCGHKHKSIKTAFHCLEKDRRSIQRMNRSGSLSRSYSDREIQRTDGNTLSDHERETIDELEAGY